MASALYTVTVDRVEDDQVEWTVKIVHPDIFTISEQRPFAFSLLMNPFFDWKHGRDPAIRGTPMADEVDVDDFLDIDWVRTNAGGFVKEVELVDTQNYPPPGYEDENYDQFWRGDERAEATLKVTVTHPGWLEHLQEGMSWESASFDMGECFEWEGAPRRPRDMDQVMAESEVDGLHPLEKTRYNAKYFERYRLEEGWLVPSKGSTHYRAVEPLEGDSLTEENVERLVGQPVVVTFTEEAVHSEPKAGLLAPVGGSHVHLFWERGDGSCGVHGFGLQDAATIGRAWLLERRHKS